MAQSGPKLSSDTVNSVLHIWGWTKAWSPTSPPCSILVPGPTAISLRTLVSSSLRVLNTAAAESGGGFYTEGALRPG